METQDRKNIDRSLIGELLGEIVRDARGGGAVKKLRVGLMSVGSEHARNGDGGQAELLDGAVSAMLADRSLEVVMIGPRKSAKITSVSGNEIQWIETDDCEADIVNALNKAIESKDIAGAVALHYPFPVGVATVGRVITPLKGKPMLIASTTGTTSTDRVEAMLKNAVCGISVAKSLGIASPTVGILNVDGASSVYRLLGKLGESGYRVKFGESVRSDGGSLLRGNDLLAGAVDVCVTDTLTGNVLMKLFSSWNNGGVYETAGYGYGPSVGEGWSKTISIISRASGSPVIANALLYTAEAIRGNLASISSSEFESAAKSGIKTIYEPRSSSEKSTEAEEIAPPPSEPTDDEIHGIDVLSIDDATRALWSKNIYAEASMGCTGPVVKIPSRFMDEATKILTEAGYL